MEFEKDTPITDEQRERAARRQATITPLDPFIKPESDAVAITITETHANIERDAENTSKKDALVQPSAGQKLPTSDKPPHPARPLIIALAIGSCLVIGMLAGGLYFLYL